MNEPYIPRLREGELICGACGQPGQLCDTNERGHRIEHAGRLFPCRVPLDDPAVALFEPDWSQR